MGKVYHILLIDDEESDIKLIETELTKLHIQVQIDVIQKKEQLIERLENNPPDLVISDYTMPTLTGTDALRIVQDRHPQLPFILVAGSIGEDKAINFMLQGASDYVMKQNPGRLGPAILRELVNYEDHKKLNRRLDKSHSQFENLVQSVNGIVWEADAETLEFLYVSPQSKQIVGFSPEEWLSEPNFWQQHIHPDDRKEAIQFCHHKTRQGEDHSFGYRMLDANGEVIWLRDYVTVVTENGKPHRLCGFMVDISGEKKAERQLDKAYELANIGHWELDLIHNKLYWSNAVKKLHEVNIDYEPDLETALEFYKEGEHREKITRIIEKAIETGESFEVEPKIITTNGNEKWVRVVGEIDTRKGKSVRIYGSTQDISKRKETERKLQESLELYEYVTKATDHIIYDWNFTEDVLYWDDSFHKKFIYDAEEGTYSMDDWSQNVHPEDLPEAEKSLNALLQSSKSKWEQEYRFKKQDGTYATVFERGYIIRDQNGDAIRMIGALQDITERKEHEEKLEELALVASKTTDVIFMTDPHEHITWVNKAFEQFSGYHFDELIGKSPGSIVRGPDNNPETMRRISNAFKKQEALQVIVLNYSKTGDKYWFDLTLDPIFDSNGNCEGFIGIQKDVTDQIEHQQELRKSVERYETVSKATSDTIWDLDLETDTIDYSQNIYDVFGYERQQVYEIEDWWSDKIHPDDRPKVVETIEKALRSSSERFQMEYRFKAADGTYKYIYDRAFIVEEEGNPVRIIGAMRDITKRKQQEKELQASLEEKETLLLEVHHRVKNNLAIISSLITLQMMEVEDENFKKMLENTTSRIHSIAMVHELLYQSENFTEIPFEKYIKDLLLTIKRTIGFERNNIDLVINVEVGGLNINQAIPLGLMLNELVTNSLKYAFIHRKEGKIKLRIARSDDYIKVLYEDNGEGYPDHIDFADTGSLGHTLIHTLLKQLSGDFEVETKGKFRLEFQFEERKKGAHSNYSG